MLQRVKIATSSGAEIIVHTREGFRCCTPRWPNSSRHVTLSMCSVRQAELVHPRDGVLKVSRCLNQARHDLNEPTRVH
jgi:hypothetical protein